MDLERTIKEAGFDSETEAELLDVARRARTRLDRSTAAIISDAMGGAPHVVKLWGIYKPQDLDTLVLVFKAINDEGVTVDGVIPVRLAVEPEPELPAWSVAVG